MKKTLAIIFTAALLTAGTLNLTGCSNEKTDTTPSAVSDTNEVTTSSSANVTNNVVVTDDGITIDGARLKKVEVKATSASVCNLMVFFDNSENGEVQFDNSKVSIHFGDSIMALADKDITKLTANESYIQWGLPFSNEAGIKAGDAVEVYYGDTKLADVTAE